MAEQTRIDTRTIRIDPRKLKLLELNARYMRHETFSRLVENVRRDGALTGNTPFAWRVHDDLTREPTDQYLVLSGNHRVMAAIAAGLSEIDVTITDDYLTPDRRSGIQISHNALTGEDDPAILKAIYDGINDPEFRLYTGLDDHQLGLLVDASAAPISEAGLAFQTISLTFLPDEIALVEATLEQARKLAGVKAHWLVRWSDYDRFMDALEAVTQSHKIKNAATALMVILHIFEDHIDDLQAGYLDDQGEPYDPKQRVPVASVFGMTIPARLASKLKKLKGDDKARALEELLDRG